MLEVEVLEKCLFEVVTSSASKFGEHLKEPLNHGLLVRTQTAGETFLKTKLTKAQLATILEHHGREKREFD